MERNMARNHLAINKVKEKKIMEINQDYNNKKCFDCGSYYPQYISLYNGIFVCRRCVNELHKKLNSKISLILENNLNTLSINDIQYLYYGGNKKLLDFIDFEYPILKSINKNKLYLTKGMDYYRRWLKFLVDEGERPLKPSFEECSQLITDMDINKKNSNNKGNIITIDFFNNYYNYEGEDKNNIINPNIYEKTYTTNWINHLNNKSDSDINDKKEQDLSLINNTNMNTDYYFNNRTITSEREKDNYMNTYYQSLDKKKITFDQYNINFNSNNKNNNSNSNIKNKLIIKRLNLKSHKSGIKNKNLSISNNNENNNSNKINEALVKIITDDSKKVYTKPKHSQITSFQKNAPTRNKENKEKFPTIRGTYLMPTRNNNYQNIIINNNNFDKLLMYNLADRTNHFINNNTNNEIINNTINPDISRQVDFYNSLKYLNYSNNTNEYYNNINSNSNKDIAKEIVFKKKTLKNSFSINTRKRKDKRDSINLSKSIVENTKFQIIPDKRLESSVDDNNHIKRMSVMTNINNNYSIDFKKDNDIKNEIKVKKRERFIVAEHKTNSNISGKYLSNKNFERCNTNELKDSSNLKKEIKMKKLMTITRLIKNKTKTEKAKNNINLSNNILNNEKKNKFNVTADEKEIAFDNNNKNIIMNNKKDKTINHNSNEKKIKEIYLVKNTGRKVKVIKTENNMSKFKSNKNFTRNSNQNQNQNKNVIKRNYNHLKENKTNDSNYENKTQRKKEFLNYLLSKK